MQAQPPEQKLSPAPFGEKVPITRRAVVKRVNRRLRHEEMTLKATRGNSRARTNGDLGAYYVIDWRNFVRDRDIDLEVYAREVGALKGYEEVIKENQT